MRAPAARPGPTPWRESTESALAGTAGARRLASVTLDAVAVAAGVSRSTASRVLNGGISSPKARQAVQAAAEQLGFVPNRAARLLAGRRTDTIALVIPENPSFIFYDPFLAIIITTVSAACWRANLQPTLVLMDPADPGDATARFLHAGTVDGMIAASLHDDPAIAALLAASGLPAVAIGRPPRSIHFPYVDVDNRSAAAEATGYLLDQGRRHIARVGGWASLPSMSDRHQGFLDAHDDARVTPGPAVDGAVTVHSGRQLTERLLAEDPAVDALFCISDTVAAGAMQALAAAGRRVPDDVAVVGFDDFATATEVTPNLTTVAQPVVPMAEAAAQLMIGYLRDGTWGQTPQIFGAHLVRRQSA